MLVPERFLRLVTFLLGIVAVGAMVAGASQPRFDPGSGSRAVLHLLPRPHPALDTLPRSENAAETLSRVAREIEGCGDGCAGVVYLWSDRMPLSRAGVESIEEAAGEAGVELTLMETETLAAYAEGGVRGLGSNRRTVEGLLASGALAHAPALVVHGNGRITGPAILGYKTSAAYASALRRRLSRADEMRTGGPPDAASPEARRFSVPPRDRPRHAQAQLRTVSELEAVGRPGAYFRWVPGREAIAYESGGRVYILDLGDGQSREAPGYVDFVPSPDGSLFVTPAPRRSGMEFYDAFEVFRAVEKGEPHRVEAFFTDRVMQDQYPSVGILEQEGAAGRSGSRTVYRMLTSWFEGIRYREYEATVGAADRPPEIRPVGDPVQPCRGRRLSIPIMSQSGLEVAARDESTGTTKIFRMLEDGRCEEVVDLGVQTGKVAWHSSGRRLAFARPPRDSRIGPGGIFPRGFGGGSERRDAGGPGSDTGGRADGIFVYDRDEERMTRVPGSEDASALAFPEFIGSDRLVYLVPGGSGEPTVFRVIEGAW